MKYGLEGVVVADSRVRRCTLQMLVQLRPGELIDQDRAAFCFSRRIILLRRQKDWDSERSGRTSLRLFIVLAMVIQP